MSGVIALLVFAARADAVAVKVYGPLPGNPSWLAAAPDGTIWVSDTSLSMLQHLAPDGSSLGGVSANMHGPGRAVVGPDGNLWFTDPPMAEIGRVSPSGGTPTFFSIGAPGGAIVVGADGALWFTEPSADSIGRLTVGGTLTEFPGLAANSQASSITSGPDGNLWFAEPGIHKIGRISTSGAIAEFGIPSGSTPTALTAGADGNVWFTETGGVARITPSGSITEFTVGIATGAFPSGIALGRDGNVWFSERDANRIARVTPAGTITEFLTGLKGGLYPFLPADMVSASDGHLWMLDFFDSYIARVTLDAPGVATGPAADVASDSARLLGTVTPNATAASVAFEWGTSTSYGNTTPVQTLGGVNGLLAAASLSGLAPLTTYHYRLVASSAVGASIGADATFTTGRTPRRDRDRDGYLEDTDCNDANPKIHPGAHDTPGDHIDQDCSGHDARFPRFSPSYAANWSTVGDYSIFTRLVVGPLPAGARVVLSCRGPGCRFKHWKTHLKKKRRSLNLVAHMRQSKLHHGAVVRLDLVKPQTVGTVVRWRIGPPPRPSVSCLRPRAKKTTRCP
jgi:virginiamycin B lyase